MCGTNTSPPPLPPPPKKYLFHDVILKNYLILYGKQNESGSLNEVSCIRVAKKTTFLALAVHLYPNFPHIRFCTTALDVTIKQWNINIDEWVSKLTQGTYLLHCVKTNNLSTHNITEKMNKQKLRINISQNENLLTDKKEKIPKSKGYFRSTSHKQWTAVTGNEGLTLLSVEILFRDHSNKTSFDSTFARYITRHYRSGLVLGPEKFVISP